MSIKQIRESSFYVGHSNLVKNHKKVSQISVDWVLYNSSRYILLRLELNLQCQNKLRLVKISLYSGRGLLNGEQNLFEKEITRKQDPDNFLYKVMRHRKPTIQEAVVGQILEDLQLRHIPQWVLPIQNSHLVFDFLIEPNMVVECTLTERKSYEASGWLRDRALVLDRKFKILKSFEFESFTLIFLEATQLDPEKLKPLIQFLDYTDKLVTSINEFETFIREWKNEQVVSDKETDLTPSPKVEVKSWEIKDPQSTLERFI